MGKWEVLKQTSFISAACIQHLWGGGGGGAPRAKDTDLRTICNKWKLSQKEKRAEHVTSGNAYLRVRRNNKKGQKPRRRSRRT